MNPTSRPSRRWIWIAAVAALIGVSIASWVLYPETAGVGSGGQSLGTHPNAMGRIARQDLATLAKGVQLFKLQERKLPNELRELFGQRGLMDGEKPPFDPWGHDYVYVVTGRTTFEIRSSGPDGRVDTPDDLTLEDLER